MLLFCVANKSGTIMFELACQALSKPHYSGHHQTLLGTMPIQYFAFNIYL
jgi:hypothetical protein